MPTVTHSIEIQRPPAQVFQVLDDMEKLKQWVTGLEEITVLTEGGHKVGAKTRMIYHEGGRRVEMIEDTIIYDPPRRLQIQGETSGFRLNVDYQLTPIASGTRLDYRVNLQMTSLMMKLLSPLIAGSSRNRAANDLARFKALVES